MVPSDTDANSKEQYRTFSLYTGEEINRNDHKIKTASFTYDVVNDAVICVEL
jgi:hypothetical protein